MSLTLKKSKKINRPVVFAVFIFLCFLIYFLGGKDYFSLDYLQEKLSFLQESYENNFWLTSLIFFLIYVVVTALSFPGASVLTLLAGAVFGPLMGLILASLASTIGSLLAFLITRIFLRDFVTSKFKSQYETIDRNIKKDGILYLATLRLVPVFPFWLINLVMGTTVITAVTFFWVSFISMLPGTFVYVYAGQKFSEIHSFNGIMSMDILVAFGLLAIFPFFGKIIVNTIKTRKAYKGFKRPKNYEFDIVTIGAGAAGLVTSYIGAALKAKVALIEKNKMGGDCLNTGCVPSKALIKTAKLIYLKNMPKEFGIRSIAVDFKFSEVMERIQSVIREVEPHDSRERYEGMGVACVAGLARIVSPWEVKVDDKVLTTRNIVIATGAAPYVPNFKGIDKAKYVTSDTIWKIRELPKKFLVIGGGSIGCELAQAFGRLGSKVTIIERGHRILSKEDLQASHLITEVFASEGIEVLTKHEVLSFTERNQKFYVRLDVNGDDKEIEYDLALIAVGRKPGTEGLGLTELGVKLTEKGTIDVNEHLQTNFPNIYACGDVAGPYQLTHMAAHQAWYSAVNSLFSPFLKFKVDYRVVPWCTYTDPEVATVGETEKSALQKGLDIEVTYFPLADLDRAITDNEKVGFVRVITAQGSDKILGATIVASQASTMILEFISSMKHEKGLKSILGTIHIYPSLGEANKYAAGLWRKGHINQKHLDFLERFFKWRRT